MPPIYIPKMVNLEINDLRIIRQVVEDEGLGKQGFSAALRRIIREWYLQKMNEPEVMDHSLTFPSQPH